MNYKLSKQETIHYLRVLAENDSVFQIEIRTAIESAIERLTK
jgi:hypothetical protein